MFPRIVFAFCSLVASADAKKTRTLIQAPRADAIFTVPIQKQVVPVKRNNVVVSSKTAYFGKMSIGEGAHAQDFSMIFDTGSGHVIVPSSRCSSPTCKAHRRYNSKASPTARDINFDGGRIESADDRDEVEVGFGTGEVTGQFAKDTVCLGGSEAPGGVARCVKSMSVVMAVEMSEQPFSSFAFDGVMGLGLNALSLTPEYNFFGSMATQGLIAAPQFGFFLASGDDEVSEISFGGHNKARVNTGLNWAEVASPELGYWQVKVKAVRVGGKKLDYCNKGECRAMIDTGTSHLGVPAMIMDDLKTSLSSLHPGDNPGAVDCRQASGPNVEIDLGHFTITLRSKDYAKPKALLSGGGGGNSSIACRPNLMSVGLPAPLGPNLFILGEPVLRRYYTVFDWGKKQVGFGEAVHDEDDLLLGDNVVMLVQVRAFLHLRPGLKAPSLVLQMPALW